MISSPVYWIDAPMSGRLAIAARPRGGDWLEDEIEGWKQRNIELVISALEPDEERELDLSAEPALIQKAGMSFLQIPIGDRQTPENFGNVVASLKDAETALAHGQSVLIHCRQGIGRSSLLAASLLVLSGMPDEAAFKQIEKARGCSVPDTEEQRNWVRQFAKRIALTKN